MELSAFRKMSPQDQHELVSREGVMLWERQSRNFSIYLFQLDGFYVELFFFKESGEFATIKPFDNMDELSPYLREIDVGHLLS